MNALMKTDKILIYSKISLLDPSNTSYDPLQNCTNKIIFFFEGMNTFINYSFI